jgi:hypothetical protein
MPLAVAAKICFPHGGVTKRQFVKARGMLALHAANRMADALIGRKSTPLGQNQIDALSEADGICQRFKSQADESVVYIFRYGKTIKIGRSKQVEKRLNVLRMQSGRNITLVAVFPGSHREEASLHQLFKDYRVQGEWFRNEGKLKEFLKKPMQNLRAHFSKP